MKAALILTLFVAPATAAVMGVVDMTGGASLRLHDEPGICLHGARLAEYAAPGKPAIPGCWTVRGDQIAVVFLDGDATLFPMQLVRKPKDA